MFRATATSGKVAILVAGLAASLGTTEARAGHGHSWSFGFSTCPTSFGFSYGSGCGSYYGGYYGSGCYGGYYGSGGGYYGSGCYDNVVYARPVAYANPYPVVYAAPVYRSAYYAPRPAYYARPYVSHAYYGRPYYGSGYGHGYSHGSGYRGYGGGNYGARLYRHR